MARGTALTKNNRPTLAPIGGKELARRDVVADEDGPGGPRGLDDTGEGASDPVADVAKIGAPGAEVVVISGVVSGDLRREGSMPGGRGVGAAGDRREGRLG